MARRGGRGRRAPRKAAPRPEGSIRTCIGCRSGFERNTLVRLVRGPEGEVLVDRHLRAPGRGAHLCYDPQCLEKAVRRRAFSRAFRGPVAPVDADALLGAIVAAIEARARDALAIGRRAGRTVSGADALERALARGAVKLIILAEDAAEATRRRLEARGAAAGIPVVTFLDRERLGRTQGHDSRVAVGVIDENLARSLQAEMLRRDRVLVAA